MKISEILPANHGGKFKASHGYVMVWVGHDHHLANADGCAYEHRIVAEQILGRKLQPGEVVHHKNRNRADNRPENLEIYVSTAFHYLQHRKHHGRQLPNESNTLVDCLCGCGQKFNKFDPSGRPRQYVSGHNPQPRPTMDAVLRFIGDREVSIYEICDGIPKISKSALALAVSKLTRQGEIVRVKPKWYGPKGSVPRQNQIVYCECGCGSKLLRYDKQWRPRKYISGHNGRAHVV